MMDLQFVLELIVATILPFNLSSFLRFSECVANNFSQNWQILSQAC